MPTSGWLAPQTMFWSASAKLKAEAVMPRSTVMGRMKRPRLCLKPMQSDRIAALSASSTNVRAGQRAGANGERAVRDNSSSSGSVSMTYSLSCRNTASDATVNCTELCCDDGGRDRRRSEEGEGPYLDALA